MRIHVLPFVLLIPVAAAADGLTDLNSTTHTLELVRLE